MTDPLTYLTAALDAAQRDAEAATAGPWYVTPREYDEDFEASIGTYPEGANVAGHGYEGGGVDTLATATHIVRHDPASTLRRIAADRKILAEHKPTGADYDGRRQCLGCGGYTILPGWGERGYRKSWPCPTIHNMAEGWGWTEETT